MPLVGSLGKQLLLAGDEYNDDTLPRFFILHAAVLPGTLIVLLVMHITLDPAARRDGAGARPTTCRTRSGTSTSFPITSTPN